MAGDKVENAFTDANSISSIGESLKKQLINSALGSVSPLNNFGRYMSGARAVLKVNNFFCFAFGVSYDIRTEHEENWGIDSYLPQELMPKKITVSGTLGMFHIPGKSATKLLMQSNVLSFLMHKYITIEVSDQTTGQILFTTKKAVITGRRQAFNAGELSTVELTWKAIGWADEKTPQYPNGV